MHYHKEYLDLVLVPAGLLIMFSYHLYLLHRYLHYPDTTAIGYKTIIKKLGLDQLCRLADISSVSLAVTVISANTSATTYLASISLTLSSLVGAWLGTSSSNNVFESGLIYGDTRVSTISIKYMGLLTCFLLAFASFVQSATHFVHANYLISIPGETVPVKYVERAVIRGGDFWTIGLRSLYFALTLLLWFFGPIPMFVSSVIMVMLLHYLDSNSTPLHQFRFPASNKRCSEVA